MPTFSLIKTSRGLMFMVFTCAFLSIIINATGQASINDMRKSAMESQLPIVVLPSPNAATLTRTISEQVDLYTGKLSLDIPIYTLKSRNVELPISLQASANAHKVNDISSWVGLGWHLNAGGMITRVMKNLPDEWNGTISTVSFNFPGVGYLNLNTVPGENTVLDRFAPVVGPYAPSSAYTISEMKNIIHKGNWNTKTSPPNKGFDLQPDEFYFNFGKFSGKFVFDNNSNVVLISDANIFITPTISGGKITAFTVTTDDGYKYDFGNYALNAVEESRLSVNAKTMLYAYRHLGCNGPETFTHDDGENPPIGIPGILHFVYDQLPWLMSYDNRAATSANSYTPNNLMDFDNINGQYNVEYFYYPSTWYLTKITSPTGDFINLSYINNGTLTYISDRSLSYSWPDFTWSYPTNHNTYNCYFLPLGYYTGPYYRSPAIPKAFLASDFPHYPSFGDVSISTSTIAVQSKKLADITTSQGFKVEFVSTTNRVDFTGDKRLDKIVVKNNGVLVKEFLLGYENVMNNNVAETYTFNFKQVYYTYQNNQFTGTKYTNGSRTLAPTIDNSWRYRMYLKTITEKGANQETIPAYEFEYYSKADLPYRTSINAQDKHGYARDATTPPVLSKLLAGVLKWAKYPTGARKEFEYQVSGNGTSWNGLRVASIREYETTTSTTPLIVKNYTYGTFYNTDVALTHYILPDIVLPLSMPGGGTSVAPVARKHFQSTSRINPPMLTRGAVGGYDFVEVSQPNNGKYRIEFTVNNGQNLNVHTPTILVSSLNGGFTKNLNNIDVWYPVPEQTENDWKRGLPVAEYTIGQNGKKIQSTHYDYDLTSTAASNRKSLAMQVMKYRIDMGEDWNWLSYGRYTYNGYWNILKSKTVREYTPDELSYRETKVEYTYDRLTHNFKQLLFVRETKVNTSQNEQAIQRYKYPLDYTATVDAFGMGISHLKTRNVLNAVVESFQYIQKPDGSNKRYVGGLLNRYHHDRPLLLQAFSLQPSATLTSFNESSIAGTTFIRDVNYKPVQNFTTYNAYGGVREQYEESDIKESYIWDHNDTYPVAKVTNAALDEIAYSSFEADGKGHWTYNVANIGQAEKGITGRKYYVIPVSGSSQGYITSGLFSAAQKFKLTFWAKHGHPIVSKYPGSGPITQITVSSLTPLVTVNGWRYYEIDIDNSVRVEISKLSNAGTVWVDEVRLFPKNAQMTTFTFDPLVGMTSQCDPNNRIVYYEYDGLQRLRLLKDQNGNITKTLDYNYKQ